MATNEEEEIKKEFQLERMVLFTDAVFAIILTIMVLEIRLPEGLRHASEEHVREVFKEVALKFAAYVVSFALVARFWVSHLKLFRYLKDYDNKLIVLNLLFLFSVSLFPFVVSLISGNISIKLPEYVWGWTAYVFALYSCVYVQSLITQHLIKNKETLCIKVDQLETAYKYKIARINLYLLPAIMIAILIFVFMGLPYNFVLYTVIAYGIVSGRLRKKYYPGKDTGGPLIARLFKSKKKPAVAAGETRK